LWGIKRDKGQSNNVIRIQIINMATVSPSVSASLAPQLHCFGRIPFEPMNHGMSHFRIAKKIINVQRDAGLRNFQSEVTIESILKITNLFLIQSLSANVLTRL
jgi:hypothetical protein